MRHVKRAGRHGACVSLKVVAMAIPSVSTLKDVREKLLGYRAEMVADFSRISRERLEQLEAGEPPTVFEADALSRVYGIDADILSEEIVHLAPGDSVATLADMEEFKDLDDATKLRIVAASNAARDLTRLERLGNISRDAPLAPLTRPRPNEPPHRQGATHAAEIRKRLPQNAREEPIPSVRDFVENRFPAIAVLYARLGPYGPAGLSFSDSLRGPTIVLNLEGKNENPLVRRFSLAHELYYILVDWNRHEPLAMISGYLSDKALERERRANAFAVRLVCPESKIHALARVRSISPESAARKLEPFGLPYAALRLYLRNEASIDLAAHLPPSLMGLGTEPKWILAEEPKGIAGFPLNEVPPERRTRVAQIAARLYSLGSIPRDAFADALGVTPASDIERVLDFFVLEPPESAVA